MDANLHVDKLMDEEESRHGRRRKNSLLNMLTETCGGLEAVRSRRKHNEGTVGESKSIGEEPGRGEGEEIQSGSEEGMLSPAEDKEDDEEERLCKQRVLGVMRELSVFHSERVTAWRGVLRDCANKSPPRDSDQQEASTTGT